MKSGTLGSDILGRLTGMKVVSTPYATKTVRNFKWSRYRSNRVLKKLIKRYGSATREEPICYVVEGVLYVHPSLLPKLKGRLGYDHNY